MSGFSAVSSRERPAFDNADLTDHFAVVCFTIDWIIMLYTEILNKNKDFLMLYRKGQSIVSRYAVVYFRRNGLDCNRFGITAGKKIGNAVKRNRAKRIIRQAYRECEPLFPLGFDIVIVARASAPSAKSYDISSFLKGRAVKAIKKAVSDNENP